MIPSEQDSIQSHLEVKSFRIWVRVVEEAEQIPKFVQGKGKLLKSPQHHYDDDTSPCIGG